MDNYVFSDFKLDLSMTVCSNNCICKPILAGGNVCIDYVYMPKICHFNK